MENLLAQLPTMDADLAVMNLAELQQAIQQITDHAQQAQYAALLQNKIQAVKDFAVNIQSAEALQQFHALRYSETDAQLNLANVRQNFITVFGENGEVLAETLAQIEPNTVNIDGMVMVFDAKMAALQQAWQIENAPHNFMVQFKVVA